VAAQAKLSDEANIPDLRPLRYRKRKTQRCHFGTGTRLILNINTLRQIETSVLDEFPSVLDEFHCHRLLSAIQSRCGKNVTNIQRLEIQLFVGPKCLDGKFEVSSTTDPV